MAWLCEPTWGSTYLGPTLQAKAPHVNLLYLDHSKVPSRSWQSPPWQYTPRGLLLCGEATLYAAYTVPRNVVSWAARFRAMPLPRYHISHAL